MFGVQGWQKKAVIDGVKALLPFQGALRRIKRAIKPYSTNAQNDRHLLGDALRQINTLRQLGCAIEGKDVVELGTGWLPVLPLVYRLYGAAQVTTVDLERLLDARQVREAYRFVLANIETGRLNIGLAEAPRALAFDGGGNGDGDGGLADILDAAKIAYRAPFNFLNLPTRSADLIVSRTVLEHVPEPQLDRIFAHSLRVLRPGGLLCHTVDMSDHWEHIDKKISKVNFLQYEGLAWSLTGLNPQNFQNRLRRFEYVDLLQKNGFEILHADGQPMPAAVDALGAMSLIPRYRGVALNELAVVGTTIVARAP